MRNTVNRKNMQYVIFFLVAYGINFLFGIPLLIRPYIDIGVFGSFMVMLPAMGAFLVKYLYKEEKEEDKTLRNVMFALSLSFLVLIFLEISGILADKTANKIAAFGVCAGSILLLIVRGRGKEHTPLFHNVESVDKAIFLFCVLMLVRNMICVLPSASMAVQSLYGTILSGLYMVIAFPLNAVCYFGEEYGWRGFLQEKMQNKFGKRLGVVLLGILWELWHFPLWFTQYNLKPWEIPYRFVMTISFSIFLGYIYMRTRNVWICALVHCIMNVLLGAPGEPTRSENPLIALTATILFFIALATFIFAKEYSSDAKNKRKNVIE